MVVIGYFETINKYSVDTEQINQTNYQSASICIMNIFRPITKLSNILIKFYGKYIIMSKM